MHSCIKSFRLLAALALFSPLAASAQFVADPTGGFAGCACCGTFFFIPIVFLAISIALLVWVARDAKSRGMDSAVLWMLLVFFFNVIGLVIYLLARPQGITVPCPNCGNSRMQASVKCPHCGIGS